MKYEALVVVGSSGVGKTTLVNGVRGEAYADRVVIPKRFITRPLRQGDDLTENAHLRRATFEARVADGSLNPYWNRELEAIESYGFARVSKSDKRLRIYSANNAFCRSNNPTVRRVLESALVVVLHASLEERSEKTAVRSPDWSEVERAKRLADNGLDIRNGPWPVETIDTTGLTPAEGQQQFRALVDRELV